MTAHRTERVVPEDGGFVLLVLLGVIGVGSLGLLLAVQSLLPNLAERDRVAHEHVYIAAAAARIGYRQNGAFPADLDALASAGGLAVDGGWRRDPYASSRELDYLPSAVGVRVRSRGNDGQLGTADDLQFDVATETQLRLRQRLRLRLLRAVLLCSPYRLAATMSAAERAQMRTAMHDRAEALRSWLTADAAARSLLTSRMTVASATVSGLVALHALPALPPALTGAGGLMNQLGMPDARAVDGRGVALAADSVLGWIAVGGDATGGTDDDM